MATRFQYLIYTVVQKYFFEYKIKTKRQVNGRVVNDGNLRLYLVRIL